MASALVGLGLTTMAAADFSIVTARIAAGRAVKEQLLTDGRLVDKGSHLVLAEDILMSSSSYAASLIAGTARSGPQSWFAANGKSLKELEESALDPTATEVTGDGCK